MFKSSKGTKQTKRPKGQGGGGAALMQQMGFQIPNFDDPNFGADNDDDDDDVEAELKRMQEGSGGHATKRSKANQKKPGGQDLQTFHNDVNQLLGDIDRPINDDDLSDGDEDDLLAELHEITGEIEIENASEQTAKPPSQSVPSGNMLSVLEIRREMYVKAIEAAKTSGDASKSRRLDRQLKLIQELLQSARTGAPINESDIPPALYVSDAPPRPPALQPSSDSQEVSARAPSLVQPTPPPTKQSLISQPPVPVSNPDNSDEAIARLKSLALQAKAEGDMAKAKEYLIQMKNLQNGVAAPSASASIPKQSHDIASEEDTSEAPPMPLTAPVPRTVLEALQQRYEELSKRHQDAVSKGESAKARRMERLTKQYQEAIEATRKGRPYDYSELSDLPGFAPIPVPQAKTQPSPPATATALPPARPSQTQQQRSIPVAAPMQPPVSSAATNNRNDQQVQTLRLKHEQYQKLALQAKQKGDVETAKKYLIACRELEKNIAAAESDSPIQVKETPESPVDGFDVVRDDELTEELAQSDRDTIYRRLQDDLLRQMQLCARNQQMYAQMEGPINARQANEFKTLEQRCAHDIERLRQSFQHGLKAPLFHYEKRQMNVIQVNNDLTDNDLEVSVLRGINLQVPSGYSSASLETYVIVEFPYPAETPQTARTRYGTGSMNAEYADALHKFQIKRNDTKFKRLMGRKDLKLTIFYRAGFLRSDRTLGTASVKLAGLEQTATLHESVDVFENDHKKKAEGKLEVKIRIKEALGQTKSSELSPQHWLVIDRFEDVPHNSKPSTSKSPATAPSISALSRLIPTGDAFSALALNLAGNLNNNETVVDNRRSSTVESKTNSRRDSQLSGGPQSIQVLKCEADLLQEQIEQLEDHLTPDQIEQLRDKHKALKEQSSRIVENLRKGGQQALQEHIRGLEELRERYEHEEEEYRQKNEIKKADLFLNKKNLVVNEMETLTN